MAWCRPAADGDAAGPEAWAGASVVGEPWPHDASATAVTVSGSRNAEARTTADLHLRILMRHRMLGHDDRIVKAAGGPPVLLGYPRVQWSQAAA